MVSDILFVIILYRKMETKILALSTETWHGGLYVRKWEYYTILLLWYCRFAHYQAEWIEAWQGKEIDLKQVLWQEPRPSWLHLHWQDCASIDLPLTRLQCAINFERRGTAFHETLQTLYYPFEEFQINCDQCHWPAVDKIAMRTDCCNQFLWEGGRTAFLEILQNLYYPLNKDTLGLTKMVAFTVNMRVRIPEGTDCSNQFGHRWLPSLAGLCFFSLWQLLLDLCRNLNGQNWISLSILAISYNFIWESGQ